VNVSDGGWWWECSAPCSTIPATADYYFIIIQIIVSNNRVIQDVQMLMYSTEIRHTHRSLFVVRSGPAVRAILSRGLELWGGGFT
jgi:hypothetical protein